MIDWLIKAQEVAADMDCRAKAAEKIKQLPYTADGIFDMAQIDANIYKAGAAVYPIYAEHETDRNQKIGYPDIMEQMRALYRKVDTEFSFENACYYMAMLNDTIAVISPQIYENYRELADMLRGKLRKLLQTYRCADGQSVCGEWKAACGTETGRLLGQTICAACRQDILLAEKYEAIGKSLLERQD